MENYTFIDLTHKIHPDIATWDLTCGYAVKTMRDYHDCPGDFKFRSQSLDIRASAGTHIDAPAHCFQGGRDVSNLPIEELICPCIVIDVSEKATATYKVTQEDILHFEQNYGHIKPGTFVLFYTGWSLFWNDPIKYHNNLSFPSISAQAGQLLLDRNVAGIGIDTLSPDSDEKGSFVHALVLGANKYIVENVSQNAQAMPALGAHILIMPLKAEGSTESPVRLVGMIPKNK